MDNEIAFRTLLADKLCKLMDDCIRRKPPCDMVPPQNIGGLFYKFHKYRHELEPEMQELFLVSYAAKAKGYLQFRAKVLSYDDYKINSEAHKDNIVLIAKLLSSKPYAEEGRILAPFELIQSKPFTIDIMQKRKPEYKYYRRGYGIGCMCFMKPITKHAKIGIFIETYRNGGVISTHLGISEPFFFFDVALLFGLNQSIMLIYENESKYIEQLNIAIDTVDIIMPSFTNIVESVIEQIGEA